MNFGFDEDQKSLGHTVAQMLADFPALTAPDLARPTGDEAHRALAELGLFALVTPEKFDGAGFAAVDIALAVEALGAGLAPLSATSTLIAIDLIAAHGAPAQQAAWLPRLASGAAKAAIAVAEAGRGYDPESAKTAIADGRLRGRKLLVADAADADLLVVLARGAKGPALMLVERNAASVSFSPHDDLDPSAGSCAITFDDIDCGDDSVIDAAAPGPAVARLVDVAATLHAGLLTGIAGRMLDTAVEYAKTREQFGQPIGAFQAIKHRCADMAVAVENARSATYYAFWAISENAPDRARAASMAKACGGETARMVCNETIQVHGGMGFTWELGLHRFLRRAKLIEHAFGDAGWHNERILAETLAGMTDAERRRDAA